MDLFGGIDLGGTFIKAAAVDAGGTIRGRAKIPTGVEDGREKVLERMAKALSLAAEPAGGSLQAAGVGVPGLVSPEGIILRFPNFPGWDGFPLSTALAHHLGLPTVIENDANAAAIAESTSGAAKGQRDYIFITLGTGVGGGVVLDGRLRRGKHGKAAELGHIKVEPGGLLCGCGARGCVEQYASGTALAREGIRAVQDGHLPSPGEGQRVTPAWIDSLARQGNPVAGEIFARSAVYLGLALAAAVNLLDVTVFYMGGGVAGAFDLMEPPLRKEILKQTFGLDPADLILSPATCGNDAGMIGAAHLAAQSLTGGPQARD